MAAPPPRPLAPRTASSCRRPSCRTSPASAAPGHCSCARRASRVPQRTPCGRRHCAVATASGYRSSPTSLRSSPPALLPGRHRTAASRTTERLAGRARSIRGSAPPARTRGPSRSPGPGGAPCRGVRSPPTLLPGRHRTAASRTTERLADRARSIRGSARTPVGERTRTAPACRSRCAGRATHAPRASTQS